MGCGCGGKRRGIKVNINNQGSPQAPTSKKQSVTLTCQKCARPMLLKQQYFPKGRKYVKVWQCSKCGNKIIGK